LLEKRASRGTSPAILIILLPIGMLLLLIMASLKNQFSLIIQNTIVQSFTTIFLSIILEAIPFIIIGVFISSLIQIFVSEETISKILPKNKFVGIFLAGIIGIVFPVCECAIVPIVRRLLKKGMPLYIGITFMLSVPIINPVVLVSTYYAFLGNPYMVLLRAGIGCTSAMLIGFIISKIEPENKIQENRQVVTRQNLCNRWIYNLNTDKTKNKVDFHIHDAIHHHEHGGECSCGHDHSKSGKNMSIADSVVDILEHTSSELRSVGKFVIAGAFLSSIMQVVLPRKYMLSIGHNTIISIVIMIALAYLLSVCSETDAFIARSFAAQFSSGSIIAFLVFGPMMDIKNTIMLSQAFKAKFIMKLTILIFIAAFAGGIIVNMAGVKI